MYADNAQISHRQLFRQIFTGLAGVYILVIPVMPKLHGRQGILALLTGMGIYLLLCTYFVRIKTVFQYPEKYLGKFWGRCLVFFYVSWLWLMGIFLLLVIVRVTKRFLVEGSASWIILLLAGLAAYFGSHQGLERRGRMAEVCFPFLVILLGILFFLGILRMKPEYLQEMGSLSLKGWLLGTWEVVCIFLPFLFLPVTLGNVRKPGETRHIMGSSIAVLTSTLVFALVLLQGSFGLGGYEHKNYPVIDFMAGIQIPGNFLQRVDVFFVAAVVFSLLFGLGSVFFYQHELLVRVKMEKTALFAASGMMAAAILWEKMKIPTSWFFAVTIRFYGPVFVLLLILAGMKGRKKRTCAKAGALCLILSLCLTGCGVSLEDRIFPLAVSANYVDGKYQLIYGIPQLSAMTGQGKSETEGSEPQAIVYEGKTPQEAEAHFNQNQKNYLDMGHLKALILGREILHQEEALEGLLAYLEEKPSVAGNLYVFVSHDPQELMGLDGQGEESVGDYLTGILENNLEGKPKDAVSLQDLYNAWHRKEELPKLPEVTVVNKKPQIGSYS